MKGNHSVQQLLDAVMSLSEGGIFGHLLLDNEKHDSKSSISSLEPQHNFHNVQKFSIFTNSGSNNYVAGRLHHL